jgi:DNA-binding GntR family transcriptional regulator
MSVAPLQIETVVDRVYGEVRRRIVEGELGRGNRGATVATLSAEDVRAAYEARLAFEPGAARLAAMRRPAAGLAALRGAIASQRASTTTREAYAASRAFHLALVRSSENEYLVRLAEGLWVPGLAQAIYELQAPKLTDRLDTDMTEHARIADAVESGDASLAEALTRHHIESALSLLLGS